MNRNNKLLKDRKILRKVDFNLASQGRYIIVANIILLLFVASIGDYYRTYPSVTLFFGVILFLLSSVSFYLIARFDATYGAGPARWRAVFVGIQIAVSAYVGCFTACVVILDNISVNAFIMTLYTVGYCSINNVEWSPYFKSNLTKLVAAFAPIAVAYGFIVDINGLTISAGLLVILVMLIRQSRLMNVRHWDNVNTHHQLHLKARDLSHAVTEATNASEFKSEFLANITHEIRTPMNNVLGMLALLDDTNLSDQQKELQKVAVHSGEALLSLIDDIVDFSRISSGQVQLNENVFRLARCIDQSLELLGPRAHDKGMELSCIYDGEIPARVRGDQGRLVQLINNLVSNAIKYSDGTDIVLTVAATKVSDRNVQLNVSVKDNGRGIDAELQDRLFDAFSKKVSSSSYAQAGTGLGLAISKGLAECMNGEIGFSSQVDQGTEFWFTVELQLSTQQAQKLSGLNLLHNKRAMVVGQSDGLTQSLRFQLQSLQMSVDVIQDQGEVLAVLEDGQQKSCPYNVVFINIPLLQGINFDLVKSIQRSEMLADTQIIVLSSLPQRADAIRLGFDQEYSVEWLTKPLTSEKLYRTFRNIYHIPHEVEDIQDKDDPQSTETIGKRVLLVEDNAVNQMVARGMLHKLGYLVTSVINGKEALALLEEKPFDLILMDCVMPVMDGYETTKTWRAIEQTKGDDHIPIVAMTASVVEGEQQRCLAVGMDDYLSKPVNIEELNAKILQWIGAKKLDQADIVVANADGVCKTAEKRKSA